ncbi:MAG: glycosyltransferase family 4 protein [Opitutaceae bacterium]
MKTDVFLACGIGRLHLLETAAAIAQSGRTVTLLTGWAPGRRQKPFVDILGAAIRQKRLYERLSARRGTGEETAYNVVQCPVSELLMTALARTWFAENSSMNSAVWALCGLEVRLRLRHGRVFHVRSGAGGCGAIEKARRLGMRVVADHSIAHPGSIWKNLLSHGAGKEAADRFHPVSSFWRRVMNDCARADVVVVNSDYVRDTLVEHGLSRERIRVIYLGIDNVFAGAKTHHRDGNGATLRALFTGHFMPRKGSHILLAAAQILKERGVSCQFDIAGMMHDGPEQVKRLGLDDRFRFHGLLGRRELRELIGRSDLFVFPTLAEGCAKAAMEALGAGLPVLTTRECGLPRAAEGFVRILKLGSADDTATAIQEVGADAAVRAEWGRLGATYVAGAHSPECFRKAVAHFYDELLSKEVVCATSSAPETP